MRTADVLLESYCIIQNFPSLCVSELEQFLFFCYLVQHITNNYRGRIEVKDSIQSYDNIPKMNQSLSQIPAGSL